MPTLQKAEVYALLARHGVEDELADIMAAGALAESGWDTARVGDAGHSIGLFQLHDQGLGAGLSAAERRDPDVQMRVMVPEYTRWYDYWRARGATDAELAWRVCAWAERPLAYDDPTSDAARGYRAAWETVTAGGRPAAAASEVPAALWDACEAREGIPYRIDPPPDGRQTLDCSLFVQQVLAEAGVALPRTAEAQRQAVPHIVANSRGLGDWGAVQDGDLLFFTTYVPADPPGPDGVAVGHVGIRRGRLRMWDAHAANGSSGPPGVGLTDISTPYWQGVLYEARRPAYPRAGAPAVETLEQQLAAERSFSSALMHDVIGRAREDLETARADLDWERVRIVIEWLRRHER